MSDVPKPVVSKRLRTALFAALAIAIAVAIGLGVGLLFARRQHQARMHVMPVAPGDFTPADPRDPGVPTTPIPVPTSAVPLSIGFLDQQAGVAVPRIVYKAKVGDCVVARLQPGKGNPYQRLVGGERWTPQGQPQVLVRPGDAPGYCFVWTHPSDKKGFALGATAIVADDAGRQATGAGAAHVIVSGTPKPQQGPTNRVLRHGIVKPAPQATRDDQ